jgi:hypothetical protein
MFIASNKCAIEKRNQMSQELSTLVTPSHQELLFIANEIKAQLFMHGPAIPWSWGMRELQALMSGQDIRGGLQFRVSGRLFKGLIRIELTGADLYRVFAVRGKTSKLLVDGIFFDQLVEIIDNHVETPRVKQA